MEHYGLKENDSFLTPDQVFQIIADYLGMTLEELKETMFDPCPPPDEHGNFAPDGRTVDWKPLTFCNPPFSQWHEWRDKAVAEAKRGNRVNTGFRIQPATIDQAAGALALSFEKFKPFHPI